MATASKRTKAIEDAIIAGLAQGRSLRSLCAELGITPAAFSQWMASDAELANAYARAREAQADLYESEIIELSDAALTMAMAGGEGVSAMVQAAKLQVDNRKWVLERMRQGRWGATVKSEISGPAGGPIAHQITVEMVPAVADAGRRHAIEAQASEEESE